MAAARLAAGVAGFGERAAAQEAAAAPATGPATAPATQPVRRGIPAVFVMDADGSNPRPLVKFKGAKWHGSPSWSHDAAWVAFDSTPAGHPRAEVYLYAVAGPQKGATRNLGPGNAPAFSPDDGLVAFYLRAGNAAAGEAGVYLMKPDGSDRRRVCGGDHPKWSPDGKRLLVTHEPQAPGTVDEVDVATGRVTRLLTTAFHKIPGATYSPDGTKIAFVGYPDASYQRAELVVHDLATLRAAAAAAAANAGGAAAGATPAAAPPAGRVLYRGRCGWIPNWSPDGKRIAFTIDDADRQVSHVVDADGASPPATVKDQDGRGTRTCEIEWSPDGATMVFSSDREYPGELLADRPDPPASGL